jgi:heat shock protein HslJ
MGTANMASRPMEDLFQHTWKLAEMGPVEAPRSISPEFTITLHFEVELRIHGASACNRYFGTYHLDGSHLRVQQIASTLMMCPEPAMALESDYFAALEQVGTYQLQADHLTLYYDQSLLLFRNELTG